MRILLPLLSVCIMLMACNDAASSLSNAKTNRPNWRISSASEWLVNQSLQNPESILFDSLQQVFYVSNGENYDTNQAGFLSRIASNGQLLALKWVDALHRPTGMAIKGHSLFVADVNRLLEIDTRTASVIRTYHSPVNNPGFNDVAINKDGVVFLSASFLHSIFHLQEGNLRLWQQDTTLLQWVNGLACTDSSLIAAGLQLTAIHFEDQSMNTIPIDSMARDFDGITKDGEGGFFLSTVENSSLWHLSSDLSSQKISTGKAYFGDLSFLPKQKELFIPRGIHQEQHYFISKMKMDKK